MSVYRKISVLGSKGRRKCLKCLHNLLSQGVLTKYRLSTYSSNYIIKKEPKFDHRLSKFDWHDLSRIFFSHNAFT
jgi:hypothetical protein